ncbi:MAG: hypothetical protein QM664_05425 [Flavihumibacter sp.]
MTRNRRKQLLFTGSFLLLLATGSRAQEGTTLVGNVAGSSFKNDQLMTDWSVGELMRIDTRVADNKAFMLTQGLLQPDYNGLLTTSAEPGFAPGEVRILPNPVRSVLQVQVSVNQQGNLNCMLFTSKGEKLAQKSYAYYGYGTTESFNMTKLAAGYYFLYVELEPLQGGVVRKGAYKIIKIN